MKKILYLLVPIFSVGCAAYSAGNGSVGAKSGQIDNREAIGSIKQETASGAAQFYKLGREAFESSAYDQAMTMFKLALKLDPQSNEARNGLAAVLYQLGRHDEALQAIEIALKSAPNDLLLKRNFDKISAASATGKLVAPTATSNLVPELATIDRPPAVVFIGDLNRPVSVGSNVAPSRVIEVTPTTLPRGYSRVLPTASLIETAPNVYNLTLAPRQVPSAPLPAEQVAPAVVAVVNTNAPSIRASNKRASKNTKSVRLVVANGVGKKGLACGQATIISGVGAGKSLINASCTDHDHFNQIETTLYLRKGTIIDPSALAASVGRQSSLKVVHVSTGSYGQLPINLDAKLVIGKDWFSTNSPVNNKRLPRTSASVVTG
jgi:hypothetical protein